MKSIMYTHKDGTCATVEVHKKGYRAYLINNPITGNGKKETIELIPFSEDKKIVEINLLKYAQGNGFIPVAVKMIMDSKKKIFQGEVIDATDFVILSDADFNEKAKQYLHLEKCIKDLEEEQTDEIKNIKAEYGDQIKDKQTIINELLPVLTDGCERIDVEASWERDADAGMMILVRRDSGKPLQIREMFPEEKEAPTMFDHNQQQEGNSLEESPPPTD